MVKSKKKSIKCKCGKLEYMFRSSDGLKSGKCNKCIRESERTIDYKDIRGNIYTLCNKCGKYYRYSRKIKGHRCIIHENHNSMHNSQKPQLDEIHENHNSY